MAILSGMRPIIIATRGSALALAQANTVLAECRSAMPSATFELRIIKTTGDKMQTGAMGGNDQVPKGLFTKELETALLAGEADLAVHSLKDLPTEIPSGLILGGVSQRADARDMLIFRDARVAREPKFRGLSPFGGVQDLPPAAIVATSSTRRQAQLLELRPDLKLVPIRGNVGTRLQRLHERSELDALVLAAAGLARLHIVRGEQGTLRGPGVPDGLIGVPFSFAEMIPCVGQAALGYEIRQEDPQMMELCQRLTHIETRQCVVAERAFLHAMGGGCLSPVAAHAQAEGGQLRMRAVSYRDGVTSRAEEALPMSEAEALGKLVAERLRPVTKA